MLDQAFADLQGDVADEAVADDDVHVAAKNVAAFHVADKINVQRLDAGGGFTHQIIALHFFFADGKQRDARALRSPDGAVINFAHDGELLDLLGLGIDVGADVQNDGDLFLHVGKSRSQRRAIDGGERAEHKARDGHDRSSVAHADQRFGVALFDQAGRDMRRTFLLAPEGVGRRIGHGDHFGGVDHLDGQAAQAMTRQLLLDGGFDADEQDADAQLTRRENRAFDFGARRMVATHGIQSDGGHLYTTRNQTVTSSGNVSEGNLGCLA